MRGLSAGIWLVICGAFLLAPQPARLMVRLRSPQEAAITNSSGGIVPASLKTASGAPAVRAQREPPVPKELLERMAAAAEWFVAGYQNYAAEETLVETRFDRKGRVEAQRRIVCDYVLLRAPGARERVELRDVASVDGKPVGDAARRNVKWQKLAAGADPQKIAGLFEDPRRYRLFAEEFSGLGLLVRRFSERYKDRMKYFFASDESGAAETTVVIGYRQVAGEGLLAVEGQPIYPAGRAWVDPDTGLIWRIEETFSHKATTYWIAVDITREDPMNTTVLHRIVVRIMPKGRLELQSDFSYTHFRWLAGAERAEGASPRRQP